jgi:hypothetical protein
MKLRNLAGLVLPVLRESSVCEACGAPFTCGAKLSGCWCAEIQLSDETRAELRTRHSGCLCRECLEHLAAREQAQARRIRLNRK